MDLLNHVLSVYQTPDLFAAGLSDLWNNVLKNWITPIYIAGLAAFALVLLKNRSWVTLLTFIAFAAIVGVLVFAGGDLFGSKNSGLTKVAKNAASSINTIDAYTLAAPLDGATSVSDVLGK